MPTVKSLFCQILFNTLLLSTASASEKSRTIVLRWNDATLRGIRDARLSAPAAARALAIVNTCIYDAWSAYDEYAQGTQLKDLLRRPSSERIIKNKEMVVSYSALRALLDVLPTDADKVYLPLAKELGINPNSSSTDLAQPDGIANVACGAVLEYRHHDGSNQLGDLAPGPYTDWTNYVSRNKPTLLPAQASAQDPDHWQPLTYTNGAGNRVTQTFAGAHWGRVTPFALTRGSQFRPLVATMGPAHFGTQAYMLQIDDTLRISAGLSDREKAISEYWTDGAYTEQPPGHWMRIAEWVSERDHHSIDDDVKMSFILSNAMFDAGIAAWDAKAAYDSVRPITAVTTMYRGKTIRAWGGPGKGTVSMNGEQWTPYQETQSPTPPFPEFVSGHSAYSAAAAEVLRSWTGSDLYGDRVVIPPGTSKIEPGTTPRYPVELKWRTFTEASSEAGMSRRYGGIHFKAGDEAGRTLGRAVAIVNWSLAQAYFRGEARVFRFGDISDSSE